MKRMLAIGIAGVVAGCTLPGRMDEPSYRLRPASYWIERLGECEVPNEIFGSLFSSSCRTPIQAIESMGLAAVPACARALKHRPPSRGALRALAIYGPGAIDMIPALVDTIQHFQPPSLFYTDVLLNTLTKIDPQAQKSLPTLMAALSRPEPLWAGSPGPTSAGDAAMRRFAWAIARIQVAYAVVRLGTGNERALALLLESSTYEEANGGRLGGTRPGTLPRGDQEFSGRPATAALLHLVPTLAPLMVHPEPGVVKLAGSAFRQIGEPAVSDVLHLFRVGRTGPADPATRRGAVLALGEIGASAAGAVPQLELLRDDPDEVVRAYAAAVLRKLDQTRRP